MKMSDRKVYVIFADTGKPLNDKQGKPCRMLDVWAVRWCDAKGWKVRGRAVFIAESFARVPMHRK
jgi:hypothetical protein